MNYGLKFDHIIEIMTIIILLGILKTSIEFLYKNFKIHTFKPWQQGLFIAGYFIAKYIIFLSYDGSSIFKYCNEYFNEKITFEPEFVKNNQNILSMTIRCITDFVLIVFSVFSYIIRRICSIVSLNFANNSNDHLLISYSSLYILYYY
jgi:hypothetical protein